MSQRIEPRFTTDTKVTLQFADTTQQFPARIVDVSGVGFGLVVEQPIPIGEILQINLEDHRLLVTVRNCGPNENGYFVGVERIDKWLPGDAPDQATVLGRPQLKGDFDPLRVIGLRNQFSSSQSPVAGNEPPRRLMLGGIAAVIGLGVLALIWGGVRGSGHTTVPAPVVEKADKAEPETAPAKKPGPSKAVIPVAKPALASSQPQPVAHAVATAVAPAVKPAPVAGPLQVTLHASELSWVDACADGRLVFSKAFNAGETGQIKFVNVATVRSGNAGGLEIAFGSKPAERMGEKGHILMWKFTPTERQEMPPGSANACTAH